MPASMSNEHHRIVIYHQTTHDPEGNLNSILPLITQPDISVTHLIVAAIHINENPDAITLNDHAPSHPRHAGVWAELRIAQASGINVMGMLGGAAKGSYIRLDQDASTFEVYYGPLREMIRNYGLQGLDLDVEEEMSLGGVVRLIDRLRADFGPDFIITMAPVAASLLDFRRNLSGFDYNAVEAMRGNQISFYNAQFYNGWGDFHTPLMYEFIVARGWSPQKIVVGVLTTPENGHGFVNLGLLGVNLGLLKRQFSKFGGVMGWEYFNSHPGERSRPWEWAQRMTKTLRSEAAGDTASQAPAPVPAASSVSQGVVAQELQVQTLIAEIDPDAEGRPNVPVPRSFEYHSDGLVDDEL